VREGVSAAFHLGGGGGGVFQEGGWTWGWTRRREVKEGKEDSLKGLPGRVGCPLVTDRTLLCLRSMHLPCAHAHIHFSMLSTPLSSPFLHACPHVCPQVCDSVVVHVPCSSNAHRPTFTPVFACPPHIPDPFSPSSAPPPPPPGA
jgi:hypothetical protein